MAAKSDLTLPAEEAAECRQELEILVAVLCQLNDKLERLVEPTPATHTARGKLRGV
jgi:hypothetical protein